MSGENEGQRAQTQRRSRKSKATPKEPAVIVIDSIEKEKDSHDIRHNGAKGSNWFPKEVKRAEWVMIVFTAITALAAWAGVYVSRAQLAEMKSGGADTHNLVVATQNLADAGRRQAQSMDKLKAAGQLQAIAAEHLAKAGKSQAESTQSLAKNSGLQIGALQASANAAKAQAGAVGRQAEATIFASKATDKLAIAGQDQSRAVVQSLVTAKEANDISRQSSIRADRPWIGFVMPGNIMPAVGQNYTIDIGLANYGRSPAMQTMSGARLGIIAANANLADIPKCTDCRSSTIFPMGGGFAAPNLSFHLTLDGSLLTVDEIARLKTVKDVIVISARVDYLDSYGAQHHTVACAFFVFDTGFTSCANGNFAD